jgi:hypothetical protein
MTPGSYVLAHSPLTGPAAWGKLPTLLQEQAREVVVINVQDDDEPPFAERYVMRARIQIGAAELAPPTILVAHSGAGPMLPLIMAPPPRAQRPGNHRREVAQPAGYVFLDAGIPRLGQPSRIDLLREEDGSLATEFLESLRAGTCFPAWTIDDLADLVPAIAARAMVRAGDRSRRRSRDARRSSAASSTGEDQERSVIRLWPRSSHQLLHQTNSSDLFSEHMQEIAAEIWRR